MYVTEGEAFVEHILRRIGTNCKQNVTILGEMLERKRQFFKQIRLRPKH